MLWQRLFFGILMIAAIIGLVTLDAWLSADAPLDGVLSACSTHLVKRVPCGLPVTLLVVTLVILATYEMSRLCQTGGFKPATHWAAFVGAGLAVIPWVEMQRRMGTMGSFQPVAEMNLSLTVFWLMAGVLGTCLAILSRKTTEQALGNMAVTLLILLYLGFLGSFAVRIRCLRPGADGAALAVAFILIVKSGDIGAYFTGRAIGKRKLAPWLSPGKTIEGVLGALVLASAVAAITASLWGRVNFLPGIAPFSISQAIVFGALMAITGHLGDLVESAFKRDVGSKDSGRVVPAFGGLLDLIDSPIFAGPIAWLLLTLWGQMS